MLSLLSTAVSCLGIFFNRANENRLSAEVHIPNSDQLIIDTILEMCFALLQPKGNDKKMKHKQFQGVRAYVASTQSHMQQGIDRQLFLHVFSANELQKHIKLLILIV